MAFKEAEGLEEEATEPGPGVAGLPTVHKVDPEVVTSEESSWSY